MDMGELGNFIVNNGVAVAALVACFYYISHEMKAITTAVNNNTLALTRLVDKMDNVRMEDDGK